MVVRWLRRWVFWGGLLLSFSVLANPSRMVPQQIKLGEAVTWVLEAVTIDTFEQTDLTELKRAFYIERVVSSGNRLRIKLYPYQSGQVALKPIRLGQQVYQPPVMTITENPELKVVWQAPSTESKTYQNQVVYWRAEVLAADADLSLTHQLPDHDPDHFAWLTTAKVEGGSGLFGHRWRYISGLQLKQPGRYSVDSPLIWVRNDTQQQWLFVAPPSPIQVKPLPSFVPRNLPVGQLQLTANFPMRLVEKGALQRWRWQLTGQHLPPEDFSDLTESLKSQPSLEWLNPTQQADSQMQIDGLVSDMTIEQPFRVNQYGWVSLPALRLSFFDSQTGKLVDRMIESQTLISVPAWMIWLTKIVWWLFIFAVLMVIGEGLRLVFLKWRLIRQLRQAVDSQQVWIAIQNWTKNSQAWLFLNANRQPLGLPTSHSLGQWLSGFEKRYGSSVAANKMIEGFNASFYSQNTAQVQPLALDWAKQLPNFDLSAIRFKQSARKIL